MIRQMACGDYLIVRPLKEERKSAAGIIMPGQGDHQLDRRALVLSAGPGEWDQGTFVANPFEAGDVIYYSGIENEMLLETSPQTYEKVLVIRARRVQAREPRAT